MGYTRRSLLAGMGIAGLGALAPSLVKKTTAFSGMQPLASGAIACPFKLAVINDEIGQDFEQACQISGEFGLRWIELRSMWNKNVTELATNEVEDARKILAKHKLQVTDIASPLFKTDWPGAPRSSQSQTRDQFHANFDASAQDKLLERCISLCKSFNTERIRCFDYWRLDDQKPYRAAINAKLEQAAETCAKHKRSPAARKRNVLQHRNRGRGGCRAQGDSKPELHAELGSRQRRSRRKHAVPNRLQRAPQRSHRALSLQGCGEQARSQIRLGSGRQRHGGLGWATAGFAA